jgi:large subunit ribosomal protein L32e
MSDLDRLLKIRTQKRKARPKFKRYESWRYNRVKGSWRRSRGIDSKVRRKKKGNIVSPNIGYRSPKKIRYLHSSGFEEAIVHNMTELEKVNPRKQVVKIAGAVGRHKRIMMQDRADELDILVLNRTRILLPGEELLMEEGRGFEREEAVFEDLTEMGEEEEEESFEESDFADEIDLPEDEEED